MSTIPNLILLSGETVDKNRFTKDTYTGGRGVEGSKTVTLNIPASVQPPKGQFTSMILQFEEGMRTKEWIVVYCALGTFREADDRKDLPPDEVVYEGDTFEVQKVIHRRGLRLTHDVVLAVRLEG